MANSIRRQQAVGGCGCGLDLVRIRIDDLVGNRRPQHVQNVRKYQHDRNEDQKYHDRVRDAVSHALDGVENSLHHRLGRRLIQGLARLDHGCSPLLGVAADLWIKVAAATAPG